MLRLPRLLPLCHVRAALPMRFMKKALSTRHKMLRLPRKCKTPHCKVLRLPRENDALALTRFQSIAPVTQNTKMTSHLLTRKRQNEHFVRGFLQISHAEEIFQEALPHGSELTTTRGPPDDDTTTTRRRHDKHDANTGPTPDPNYKREPLATHSGKNSLIKTHSKSRRFLCNKSWLKQEVKQGVEYNFQ